MKRVAFLGTALLALATGSPSLAADMPLKAPPAPVVDPWLWTGFYVGANGGYSWGRARTDLNGTVDTTVRIREFRAFGLPAQTLLSDVTTVTSVGGFATDRTDVDGWVLGGQAGYNWQSGRFVFGIEADIQATGQEGDILLCPVPGCAVGTPFATASYSLDWFGTLRGRVGVTFDRYLVYGTGGLAVGGISTDYAIGFNGGPTALFSSDTTRTGWAAGGGIEGFITRNWTVKLEYLYMDLGDYVDLSGSATTPTLTAIIPNPNTTFVIDTFASVSGLLRTRFTDSILRLGVNYKF
jgi:outer membrane immunogenic protein